MPDDAVFSTKATSRAFIRPKRRLAVHERRTRRAAVQTKRYTIDDNDKAAVYATIAADPTRKRASPARLFFGLAKIDLTGNYVAQANGLASRSHA